MTDRPPSYRTEPAVEFADRLERVLVQRLTAPSTSTLTNARSATAVSGAGIARANGWTGGHGASIDLDVTAAPQRPARSRPALKIVLGAAAAAAFVVSLAAIVSTDDDPEPADVPSTTASPSAPTTTVVDDPAPTTTVEPTEPSTPFEGNWESTDADGNAQTMAIEIVGDGSVQVTIHTSRSYPCSDGAATVTGVGQLDSGNLVIAAPVFTCDDGSEPLVVSPPIDERLSDLTFTHDPASDTLTGSYAGAVWRREGAEAPSPESAAPSAGSGTTRPQSDLETIAAGVAAFYSGDADRAAELFELPDRADHVIRQEAAYQAVIGGRLDGLHCAASTPGAFECSMEYRNALTDAAGDFVQGPFWRVVVVEDGVITAFGHEGRNGFPELASLNIELGSFLAAGGRLEGYEDCAFGPLSESCGVIQLENLDDWAQWRTWRTGNQAVWDAGVATSVESALTAWYSGDCRGAHYLAGAMFYVDGVMFEYNAYQDGADALCPSSASSTQTIEYESILGAEVTVEACEGIGGSGWYWESDYFAVEIAGSTVSCEVHYSNAMSTAVENSPSATRREFRLTWSVGLVTARDSDGAEYPWYLLGVYPEDAELRDSFRLFAEGGELRDEYAAASCATERTPKCAYLIMDNLDDWATWHHSNG